MIKQVIDIFMNNTEEIFTAVIIMVSAVIVLMEILKERVFNRIKNKNLRRFALSFSSIAIMYATVAGYFIVNTIDFKYFAICGSLVCVAMIVIYWFYKEFLQVRDGIFAIGSFVIRKFFKKGVTKVNEVASGMEMLGSAIDDILKSTAKKSEENSKKQDLKNL